MKTTRNAQRLLKLCSVFVLVAAFLFLVTGIMVLLGAYGGSTTQVTGPEFETQPAATGVAASYLFYFVVFAAVGALGVRRSEEPRHALIVLVLSIMAALACAYSCVTGFDIMYLLGAIVSVAMAATALGAYHSRR